MNPDIIGYVWTGEYDLNTLRVDGEIFESGTKKLRIRKYPDTCGRGLIRHSHCFAHYTFYLLGDVVVAYTFDIHIVVYILSLTFEYTKTE